MAGRQIPIAMMLALSTACAVFAGEKPSIAAPGFRITPQGPDVVRQTQALTESFVDRARRGGRLLEMTAKDAIRMALENNLEIAIEDVNEEISRTRYVGTQGYYDPVLSLEGGYADNTTPTGSVIQAGAVVVTFESVRSFWNSHLLQNLPWGASYNVDWVSSRFHGNSTLLTVNPQFNSTLTLTFTQPLLRGYSRTQIRRDRKSVV